MKRVIIVFEPSFFLFIYLCVCLGARIEFFKNMIKAMQHLLLLHLYAVKTKHKYDDMAMMIAI